MAVLKNKELNTLIKMENLIGRYSVMIFGENKDNVIQSNRGKITHQDFIDYMNIVEQAITDKEKMRNKVNTWNKKHSEYHNIMNNIYYAKKTKNAQKLAYWGMKLENLKKEGRV